MSDIPKDVLERQNLYITEINQQNSTLRLELLKAVAEIERLRRELSGRRTRQSYIVARPGISEVD